MKSPVDKRVILASGSPRRRQLLEYIVPEIEVARSRDIDETYPGDLPADDVAPYLSRVKADGYADLVKDDSLVITADTVVILDGKILGKPADEEEAVAMLSALSGRSHRVVTGVTVKSVDRTVTFKEVTEVVFDTVSQDDIRSYVDDFRPLDKAGAYGIQEWIGCIGITGIKGCYYNVMGLPLHALYKVLRDEFGYTGSTSK